MTDIAEILQRLRCQRAEVATLAADAIERLAASEAEARATVAQLEKDSVRMLELMRQKFSETELARQFEGSDVGRIRKVG